MVEFSSSYNIYIYIYIYIYKTIPFTTVSGSFMQKNIIQ